jgi:hypothetical protein
MYIRSLQFSILDEIQPEIDTVDTCQKLSFTFQKWLQIWKISNMIPKVDAEFMLIWVQIIVMKKL